MPRHVCFWFSTKLGELCWTELGDYEVKAIELGIAAQFQGKTPAFGFRMHVLKKKKDEGNLETWGNSKSTNANLIPTSSEFLVDAGFVRP